jgi:hypothetical protein
MTIKLFKIRRLYMHNTIQQRIYYTGMIFYYRLILFRFFLFYLNIRSSLLRSNMKHLILRRSSSLNKMRAYFLFYFHHYFKALHILPYINPIDLDSDIESQDLNLDFFLDSKISKNAFNFKYLPIQSILQYLKQHKVKYRKYCRIKKYRLSSYKYRLFSLLDFKFKRYIHLSRYFRKLRPLRIFKTLWKFNNRLGFNNTFSDSFVKLYSRYYLKRLSFLRKKLRTRKKKKITHIHLKSTYNNFFITVTDSKGNVKAKFNIGNVRFKKGQRKTMFAVTSFNPVLRRILYHYLYYNFNNIIIIKFNGYKFKLREIFRNILYNFRKDFKQKLYNANKLGKYKRRKHNLIIYINRKYISLARRIRFQNITSTAFNGTRKPRKPRK